MHDGLCILKNWKLSQEWLNNQTKKLSTLRNHIKLKTFLRIDIDLSSYVWHLNRSTVDDFVRLSPTHIRMDSNNTSTHDVSQFPREKVRDASTHRDEIALMKCSIYWWSHPPSGSGQTLTLPGKEEWEFERTILAVKLQKMPRQVSWTFSRLKPRALLAPQLALGSHQIKTYWIIKQYEASVRWSEVNKAVRRNFFQGGGGGQDYLQSRGKASEGAKRPSGGRVWGGTPPPTWGSFCIFEIEIERSGAHFGWIFKGKIFNKKEA